MPIEIIITISYSKLYYFYIKVTSKYYVDSILTILYTFIQFWSSKTSTLKSLAEINELPIHTTETQCLANNE